MSTPQKRQTRGEVQILRERGEPIACVEGSNVRRNANLVAEVCNCRQNRQLPKRVA